MLNDNRSLVAINSIIYNNISSLLNENDETTFNQQDVILSTANDIWTMLTTTTTTSQNDILNLSNYNITNEINTYLPCDPRNIAFNCSKDDYLLFCRGPQRLPLFTALMVTVFFVGIFVTGVVGNVIVCVVIVKQSVLHTATNYYLFSLAVSDLMLLLGGLPFEISIYWHQYPYNMGLPFCKLRALISEASSYVSVLTIVAFSMERFLAICHPLHLYTMSGFKRALRIIAALWVISFLSAAPFAIFTEIDYIEYPPDRSKIQKSAFCAMLENPPGFPLWELSFCLFFVIPMILIMILYFRMGWQIRSRTKTTKELGVTQGSMHKESRQHQSRKAIIRMLAAVVITFFVCWAPFHAQRLAYLYIRDWVHFEDLNTWLFSVAGWFYYVSCTLNPILYNVMSHRYRVAFKETLCGRRRTFNLAREQSSFRETVVASGAGYENSHLVHVRSVRSSNYKDRNSINANMVWKNNNISRRTSAKMDDAQTIDKYNNSDSVVVIDNTFNGRPKVLMTTNNECQENLQKKNETYI